MASITADSELMTNYIAAVPVPAGAKFMTVLDENRRPMVLSLSNDDVPKLQFIRNSGDGAPILLNLATNLGIEATDAIQTFSIRQANDLRLYLTVAYGEDSTTSKLILARPFMPQDLQASTKLPVIPGETPVNTLATTDYPTVYIVHKTLDQTVSWGSDITEISVNEDGTKWSSSKRMATPENTSEVLDIAPAANAFGKGLFVLYKSAGQSKLYARFLRTDPNANDGSTITFVTSVMCSSNASCIASLWDPRNRSALLIGSPEGVRYLSPSESVSKTAPGKLLSSNPLLKDAVQLVVAQDNKQVSVWFRNRAEQLGYIRGTSDDLGQSVVSLLLPSDQASSFAASIAQPDAASGHVAWQMLVSNDNFGNLTLLEQAMDTGIWRRTPFYTPSNTENITVQSYTITLHARDSKGNPVRNGQVFIKGSSSVNLIQNGRNTILPQTGSWFSTDSGGALNFIVATDSLASQAFNISRLQTSEGTEMAIEPFSFNPAAKAMDTLHEKMTTIQNPDDFRAAKTQDGSSIFAGAPPDDETLKQGIQALGNLKTAYDSLPADGSLSSSTHPENRFALATRGAPTSTITMSTVPVATTAAAPGLLDSVSDFFWDGWHWVKQKVHDAYDWVVEKVGDAWHFICKIGDEIKQFVLDCIEKVGEALTWVFDKIKAAWDKVVEWIGFIFGWGDILECKDTISSVITAGLELGAAKVGDVAAKADAMFIGLLADVDKFMVVPKSAATLSGDSGSGSDKGGLISGATSSTKFNWANERLKNGGAGTSTQVKTSESGSSDNLETWQSVFQPALDGVKSAVTQVADDISDLFHKQGSMTVGDFMSLGKDIIKLAIQTIRGLVSSLLKLVKMLLEKVNDYGNASINIPIFSSLYRLIAKHDLTVFDAISLILAIPTTIFMKIITGRKPPQLSGLDGNLLGQIVLGPDKDGKEASAQTKLDFNTLTAGVTVSGVMVSTIVQVIKLAYKTAKSGMAGAASVFEGAGGFLETFSIIVDMIGTLHAMPTDTNLPGLKYRKWVAYISLIRGASHLLVLFAGAGETADKVLLVFDLLTALTNFGLQQATYSVEFDEGSKWKDFDDETSTLGTVSSGFNAIAAVGYFGAFMTKSEDPEAAAVGLAILSMGTVGLAVVEGIMFKRSYDLNRRALLVPPSV